MFPTNGATPQTSTVYSLTASGTVKHLVSGLTAGSSYAITQGGSGIGSVTAEVDGSVAFTSIGGGTFQIAGGSPVGAPTSISGNAELKGATVIH
jgi:hypothetical protein